MPTAEVTVTPTTYTVSVLPFDHIDADAFSIQVEMRSEGSWAVCNLSRCLDSAGAWGIESIPSERTDEWKATHRFDLDTALELARKAAPNVRWNRITASEIASAVSS